MPELCRVGICGFDPMLVKGYTAQNMRAIWWHISDELFEEFDMKPGMKVSGKILKLYDGKDGLEFSAPNEDFEWETSKETATDPAREVRRCVDDLISAVFEARTSLKVVPGV